MRRALIALVVSSTAALGLAASPASPASSAAPVPVTGRVVSAVGGHAPVVGATVRLRALGPGSAPGAVVATDVTNAQGRFALDASRSDQEEFYVQLVAGRFQAGYAGGVPLAFQQNPNDAGTWGPHSALGRIFADPAFINGVVVDSVTAAPVPGVKVTVRKNDVTWQGVDVTDSAGRFTVTGLTCEDDCSLKLGGSAVGYETGYRACDATVLPTWGEACASPLGWIGKVFLDVLPPA